MKTVKKEEDINYLKGQLEVLEKENEKIDNYLSIASTLIVALKSDETIEYVNNEGCNLLGYRKEDILGKNWMDTFIPEKERTKVKEFFKKVMMGKEALVSNTENLIITKKGERVISWHNASIRDQTKKIVGVLSSGEDITERKKMDDVLKKSEENYHLIFETAASLITSVDKRGIIVDCNSRIKDVLGYKKEEIIGNPMSKIIHPDYIHEAEESLQEILTTGFSYNKEYELIKKNKKLIDVRINSSAIKDKEGKYERTLCIIDDITERKMAEKEIAVNASTQEALNRLLHISLGDVSLQSFLEKALEIILSIPWLALMSKGSIFIVDDQDPGSLIMNVQKDLAPSLLEKCARVKFGYCLCGKAASTRKIIFCNHLTKDHKTTYDGIREHGHYCIPIISGGKTLGVINTYVKEGHHKDHLEERFLLVFADALAGVLKRKKAELALSESEEKYRLIFENAGSLLATLDRNGKILDCNSKITEMLGYEVKDAIGKNMTTFMVKDDAQYVKSLLSETFEKGERKSKEFKVRKKDKSHIYASVSFTGIKNEDGKYAKAIAVLQDVTEKKLIYEAINAEKNELEAYNTMMIGRELKMIELKKEVNELLKRHGEKEKYETE